MLRPVTPFFPFFPMQWLHLNFQNRHIAWYCCTGKAMTAVATFSDVRLPPQTGMALVVWELLTFENRFLSFCCSYPAFSLRGDSRRCCPSSCRSYVKIASSPALWNMFLFSSCRGIERIAVAELFRRASLFSMSLRLFRKRVRLFGEFPTPCIRTTFLDDMSAAKKQKQCHPSCFSTHWTPGQWPPPTNEKHRRQQRRRHCSLYLRPLPLSSRRRRSSRSNRLTLPSSCRWGTIASTSAESLCPG